MIGFSDLLRDRDLSTAERGQFLDTISRNGRALTRIIDDILDLAKVESGQLHVELIEFSFEELLHEVTELFGERAHSKGIYLKSTVAANVPARLRADPTRVRQILINIIGNAVKFTGQGGVTVRVDGTAVGSELRIEVRVTDTGIGISGEERDKLFRPFVQADNTTTRKYGGTGLGLALSKRLASALGGDVVIEPDPNDVGVTFLISFMARAAVAVQPTIDPPAAAVVGQSRLDGIHVLVADDSPDNLELIGFMLKSNGATLEQVTNGAEAFRRGMSGHYDVVLMDVQMPIMDGYAATRSLREAGFKTPVVALTAHAMAEERARSIASGCDNHLTKPFSEIDLVNTLTQILRMEAGPI